MSTPYEYHTLHGCSDWGGEHDGNFLIIMDNIVTIEKDPNALIFEPGIHI